MKANTYSPEEAAKFLNISPELLANLTNEGKIQQQYHSRKRFYLGGELDAAKAGLHSMLKGRY